MVQVGDVGLGQYFVIEQELFVEFGCLVGQYGVCGVGQDFWCVVVGIVYVGNYVDCIGGNDCVWLQCIYCYVLWFEFGGQFQCDEVYVYFGQCVIGMWFLLFWVEVGWWGQGQDVWIGCLQQVWQVGLCVQEVVV